METAGPKTFFMSCQRYITSEAVWDSKFAASDNTGRPSNIIMSESSIRIAFRCLISNWTQIICANLPLPDAILHDDVSALVDFHNDHDRRGSKAVVLLQDYGLSDAKDRRRNIGRFHFKVECADYPTRRVPREKESRPVPDASWLCAAGEEARLRRDRAANY